MSVQMKDIVKILTEFSSLKAWRVSNNRGLEKPGWKGPCAFRVQRWLVAQLGMGPPLPDFSANELREMGIQVLTASPMLPFVLPLARTPQSSNIL